MLVATALVVSGKAPPVFNEGFALTRIVHVVLLIGLLFTALIMAAYVCTGRLSTLSRWIRMIFVWAVLAEVGLWAIDHSVVSVKGSILKSAFRNEHLSDGETVVLPQPNALSPFGFRTPRKEDPRVPGYRVLFLGDSYVQGSGSTFDVNYTQVVERELREMLPERNISVMSAGVAGAGVHDYRLIYEYLLERGFVFDAVVLNIFLGNDLTDDVPGTVRPAVVGEHQRFHQNAFLRFFYALDSYTYRYAIFLYTLSRSSWLSQDLREGQSSSCTPSPGYIDFIRERARFYYGNTSRDRVYVQYAASEAREIAVIANDHQERLWVVLLPDPAAVLDDLRGYLNGEKMDWDWTRKDFMSELGSGLSVLDLTPMLRNRSDLFLCNNNHWNDAGNVAAAQVVAAWLSARIPLRSGIKTEIAPQY
jgi:hypothetical protein